MPDYLVKPVAALGGWAVCLDGAGMATHFTQGAAVADALRRAGLGGRVRLQEADGRTVDLPRFEAAPRAAGAG